jgi:hypothetical protein
MSPATDAVARQARREAFEAWHRQEYPNALIVRDAAGGYAREAIFNRWIGWRAAAEAGERIPRGNVVIAGDIVMDDGDEYERALVVQFDDVESVRQAIKTGRAEFTVFGKS